MIRQTIKNAILHSVVFCLTVLIFWIWYAAITNVWTTTSTLEVSSWSTLSADSWNKLLWNFEVLKWKTENIYGSWWNTSIWTSAISSAWKLNIYWNGGASGHNTMFNSWDNVTYVWIKWGVWQYYLYANNDWKFGIHKPGVWDRITILDNWNVWIWNENPWYKLTVNGQPAANGYTQFTNYSDERLKENISSIWTWVLEKILKLNPVNFQYNDKYFDITWYQNNEKNKVYKWFIAQELKKVFPEMVSNKWDYLDADLSNLQIYLLKAIQEQQEIIKNQQKQIDELKIKLEK